MQPYTSGASRSSKVVLTLKSAPELIYSDNAATFQAAAKWLKEVRDDEKLNNLLVNLSIEWRFNLSRTPWWGGQFECLIGVFMEI